MIEQHQVPPVLPSTPRPTSPSWTSRLAVVAIEPARRGEGRRGGGEERGGGEGRRRGEEERGGGEGGGGGRREGEEERGG